MIKEKFKLPRKCIHEQDYKEDFIKTDSYYAWYYTYGKFFNPKSYLEIGVRLGYSTIAVGLGSKQLKNVYLYDNNSGEFNLNDGLKNIKKVLHNVQFKTFILDTQKITELNCFADMAHIDGEHTKIGVYNDLKLIAKCINLNGVVIIDDTKWIHIKEGVLDFLNEVKDFALYEEINNLRGHILLQRTK